MESILDCMDCSLKKGILIRCGRAPVEIQEEEFIRLEVMCLDGE